MWVQLMLILAVLDGGIADRSTPESVVESFMQPIETGDLELMGETLTGSATMFAPFRAARLDSRAEILATVSPIFERLHARGSPPFMDLQPTEMRTQPLGTGIAMVTWHLDRPGNFGRRSALVQRGEDGWRIVSFHSSNMTSAAEQVIQTPRAPASS